MLRDIARDKARMARWPSGQAEVCKTLYAGSIPARASTLTFTDIRHRSRNPKTHLK